MNHAVVVVVVAIPGEYVYTPHHLPLSTSAACNKTTTRGRQYACGITVIV